MVRMLLVPFNVCSALIIPCLPAAYFIDPGAVITRFNSLNKGSQSHLSISHNRHGSDFDFMHLRGVNIDMNNLRTRCKFADLATYAIIEAQPNTDDQVRGTDGTVDMRWTMHTWHTERQGVGLGESTQTKQGRDDRNMCFLGESKQLFIGI